MIKKESHFSGLREITVPINDKHPNSHFFRVHTLPTILTGGKNLIKLKGSSFLKGGSAIQIEILAADGSVIYHEVPKIIDDDNESRIIAIYIYEDTCPGDATITIVGEAAQLPNGESIKPEWRDRVNVKWQTKIPVDPFKQNISEIYFENKPTITVEELIKVYLDQRFPVAKEVTLLSGTNGGRIKYFYNGRTPIVMADGFNFPPDAVNGTLTINNPASPTPQAKGVVSDSTYTTTVTKVLSQQSATLKKPYSVQLQNNNFPHVYQSFSASHYTLSYYPAPTYSLTENSRSFAYIKFQDLEPVTGEIKRIKTFFRSAGSLTNGYELLSDVELNSTNILIDTGSLTSLLNYGTLDSQLTVDTYWTGSGYQVDPPSLVYDETRLNKSFKVVSGSAYLSVANKNDYYKIVSVLPTEFIENTQYCFIFDAVAQTSNTTKEKPLLEIYMSGSAFKSDGSDYSLGKKVATVQISKLEERFDDKSFDFVADSTGWGKIIFKISAGDWSFSDIKVRPCADLGYNPTYAKFLLPVPTLHLNDYLDFKFEYYNNEGLQSTYSSEIKNVFFKGANTYIAGGQNLLTGSMFIGRALQSGIEMSGKNSAYIRSIGYQSFNLSTASVNPTPPGFMIWSGSVLPGTPDNYKGVGVELSGGRGKGLFRFRSSPGDLLISADIVTGFNPSERLEFSLTDNVFYFYLTRSVFSEPIIKLGSGFVVPGVTSGHPTSNFSGMFIKQPKSFARNVQTNTSSSGIFLTTEDAANNKTVLQQSLIPGSQRIYHLNHTQSAGTEVPTCQFVVNAILSTANGNPGQNLRGSFTQVINAKGGSIDIYGEELIANGYATNVYGKHITINSNNSTNNYGIYASVVNGSSLNYSFFGANGELLNADTYNNTTATAADVVVTSTGLFQRSTSDIRIKKDITPITGALDIVTKLQGRYFYEKKDIENQNRMLGFVAQEVLPILPEAVPTRLSNSSHSMHSVAYGHITALLVEAIKEQQKQIEELKNIINSRK